jgi:two-component system sensor histidine kinase YesM
MAEINDDQEVADQLYALGRMLRLSISDASSMGEVSMEIEHAQMYLQLQKMRLNNQLDYEIKPVPEEILHVKCPRFLLQPLVENALKHGFQQKNRPGRIAISTGSYEKGIWLRVFNDGAGLTPERLEEVREGLAHNQPIVRTRGGIGLVNVNSRLKLFFGQDSGITIESIPEEGTTCTLWLVTHA